jgi:hypothetical protein
MFRKKGATAYPAQPRMKPAGSISLPVQVPILETIFAKRYGFRVTPDPGTRPLLFDAGTGAGVVRQMRVLACRSEFSWRNAAVWARKPRPTPLRGHTQLCFASAVLPIPYGANSMPLPCCRSASGMGTPGFKVGALRYAGSSRRPSSTIETGGPTTACALGSFIVARGAARACSKQNGRHEWRVFPTLSDRAFLAFRMRSYRSSGGRSFRNET